MTCLVPPGTYSRRSTSRRPCGSGRTNRSNRTRDRRIRSLIRPYAARDNRNEFHPSIDPSMGASARPAMIEAAITMPPVISPCSARLAPQPNMPICVNSRAPRLMEAKMMLRSWARTCAVSEPAVSLPQMRTASGTMAIALIIWLLRAIESRCMFARLWAMFASAKGLAVIFWFTIAMTSNSNELLTTIMPRCGWTRKITDRNSGAKGTSRKEISVPDTRNPRTCCRSDRVWYSLPLPCNEAWAAALRIGAPRRAATSTALRIRMNRRRESSIVCTKIAPTITIVSITSVSTDLLVKTRSEIWKR